MADRKKIIPVPRLLLIAAAAGALAGAVAVYVTGGLDGNNAPPAPVASAEDDTVCPAKAEMAKAVAAAATGHVAAMLPADPPQSLASLAFTGPEGEPMTLADHTGKTVLLNLWATWCAPCREEMPALDALELERGGDTFEVVAINIDTGDDSKPKKFLEEVGIRSLGYYRDASMRSFNDLKKRGLALGLPVTLLIDADGCLLASMNGPADWSGEDAHRMLDVADPR